MKPIPIAAAKRIAEEYGYDQVVVYGRRCHDSVQPHGEHLTTYGRTKQHCSVAAAMGDKLKQLMGWQTAKERWVEKEAIDRHVKTDKTGRFWSALSEEEREAFRVEARAEWDQD
jgi:hypothetical protein